MSVCVCARAWTLSCSVVSYSHGPHGLPSGSLSMEFSRQEYWSELHFLLQELFLTLGSNPSLLCLLHWQADSLPLCHLGNVCIGYTYYIHTLSLLNLVILLMGTLGLLLCLGYCKYCCCDPWGTCIFSN